MESLVASVLLIVIFMVSSTVLNTMVRSQIAGSRTIDLRLNQIEYEIYLGHITPPYTENFEGWDIEINQHPTTNTIEIKFRDSLKTTSQSYLIAP